jgi:hypothetical protein
MSVEEKLYWRYGSVRALVAGVGLFVLAGCTDGALPSLGSPTGVATGDGGTAENRAGAEVVQRGTDPPSGLVQAGLAGQNLTLWPYTGNDFRGQPVDPVNLIFVGQADPGRIRDALLGLNGDRTAFGFPPAFPFNATWTEAIGDVQTNYAGEEGWLGNVVQLELGSYESVRVHLRLFRTGEPFAGAGTWTVGAAHFEVLIPGTADHQVLSWEHAEQIVAVDLIRSGLLEPSTPPTPSVPINEAPSFREIPPFIYNELPVEMKGFIGGPLGPVDTPVGIPTDGNATILRLAGSATPVLGPRAQQYTLLYDQVVPKPFCSDGPADWVHISGPVNLQQEVEVDAGGRYRYHSRISGQLTATPVDISQTPPTPVGEPFQAVIGDRQHGFLGGDQALVDFETRRVAPQGGGSELQFTRLKVSTRGEKTYRSRSKCMD